MEIIFSPQADKDLKFFVKSGNKAILKKVSEIITSIKLTPFEGIGKPEQLKYELSEFWSRRINREHRLVYKINDDTIIITSLKGHYL